MNRNLDVLHSLTRQGKRKVVLIMYNVLIFRFLRSSLVGHFQMSDEIIFLFYFKNQVFTIIFSQ